MTKELRIALLAAFAAMLILAFASGFALGATQAQATPEEEVEVKGIAEPSVIDGEIPKTAAEVARQLHERLEAERAAQSQSKTIDHPSTESYSSDYSSDFKSAGVVYQDGTRFTWYSERVLPGGGLDALNGNGRHVDEQGYIRDGDGYIAVASSDHAQGEVVSTPWGDGKVYDSGCASGTIDVYTSW